MGLRIKKIYIDSRFRTNGSVDSSNFRIDMPQSVQLPPRCSMHVDDIIIPHSFYTVEENVNNKLYFRVNDAAVLLDQIISLTPGNYTGATLAVELQSKLNTVYGGSFTVSYVATKGIISIVIAAPKTFYFLTEEDLKNDTWGWSGVAYDFNNPLSANEMLGNMSGSSLLYTAAVHYGSAFLDLQNGIHNIYIHSDNLSSYSTIGSRGENTIIKKVPITAGFGYLVIDNVVASHDYLSCDKLSFRSIQLRLTDAYGRNINLHGANWSCSIVFSEIIEDP